MGDDFYLNNFFPSLFFKSKMTESEIDKERNGRNQKQQKRPNIITIYGHFVAARMI